MKVRIEYGGISHEFTRDCEHCRLWLAALLDVPRKEIEVLFAILKGRKKLAYQSKHFSDREFACKHCGQNLCTDELKQALDELREAVGLPVIVHDAYRCDVHNASVSLVSKSEHPRGMAADIEIPGLSLQQMYNAALQVDAFKYGGIGVYDKNFIHVDVRRGIARWSFIGNKEGSLDLLVRG